MTSADGVFGIHSISLDLICLIGLLEEQAGVGAKLPDLPFPILVTVEDAFLYAADVADWLTKEG